MNTKHIAAAIIACGILSAVAFAYMLVNNPSAKNGNSGRFGISLADYMVDKSSNILAMAILGNSSDIVYPELMEAVLIPQEGGTWLVRTTLLDDSEGPYNLSICEEEFYASVLEVEAINHALYEGLKNTTESQVSIYDVTDLGIMGFGLDILYNDGTWIQLLTIQSGVGYMILLEGTYQTTPDITNPFGYGLGRDTNLLNGAVLEPGSALDNLILQMNHVFIVHLDN
ncbi:MAG: hypothetical protein KAW94_02460 [Candidatus Thorarchaeota archaeon]|nr:hypothetical protein [Candidatus Thorarchaeota archaeon]